jgi:hypothetical protein
LAFIMLLGLTWRSKGRAASGRFEGSLFIKLWGFV